VIQQRPFDRGESRNPLLFFSHGHLAFSVSLTRSARKPQSSRSAGDCRKRRESHRAWCSLIAETKALKTASTCMLVRRQASW
jgi:hypothetical protein